MLYLKRAEMIVRVCISNRIRAFQESDIFYIATHFRFLDSKLQLSKIQQAVRVVISWKFYRQHFFALQIVKRDTLTLEAQSFLL